MLGLLVSYQTDVRLCVIFPERNDPNDVCVCGGVSCIPRLVSFALCNLELLILQNTVVIGLGHPQWCCDGISIWWFIEKPSTNLATPLAVNYLLKTAALFL